MTMWIALAAANLACLMIGMFLGSLIAKRTAKGEAEKKPFDGDIFINREGEMYAQFDIPVPDIQKAKSVTMKINYVKGKGE